MYSFLKKHEHQWHIAKAMPWIQVYFVFIK